MKAFIVRRAYCDPRFADPTWNHDLLPAPSVKAALATARGYAHPMEKVSIVGVTYLTPTGRGATDYFSPVTSA